MDKILRFRSFNAIGDVDAHSLNLLEENYLPGLGNEQTDIK
ncbi:MAG: hypothetical protein AAGA75_19630 [Cyanobacteria bacterium P01_E01_bin.6]